MVHFPKIVRFLRVYSLLWAAFLAFSACAQAQIFTGAAPHTEVPFQAIVDQVRPGTVLLLGEVHNNPTIHQQHMQILEALRQKGFRVSVGMEFFNYTDQAAINQFRQKKISEEDFKNQIGWSDQTDFSLYGPSLLFPDEQKNEAGLGLNIPRQVTSQIGKGGVDSLSPEMKKLMPPQFELGRESYRQRFYEVMGGAGHMPQAKLENYFAAQCTWDDAMAWKTVEYMKKNPEDVFVIIVGEFHVQYGGGLPYRLQQRWQSLKAQPLNIVTVSQVWAEGLSADELQAEMQVSPTEGARADFIWVSQ